MEGEHTPTIIQLIRSTDLAVIQFKDSHIFFIFLTNPFKPTGEVAEKTHEKLGSNMLLMITKIAQPSATQYPSRYHSPLQNALYSPVL